MKRISITLFSIALILFSCNSEKSNDVITEDEKSVTNEMIISNIEELQKSDDIDKGKVKILIENIDLFASQNPKDKKTPRYLELKAKYLAAMGNNEAALIVYNTIYNDYLEYTNRANALFMMAFITENNIKNKEKAKILYQKFLDEFPNDEFANDVKITLENIDKTPEEMIEMFERNQEKQ